MRAGILLPLLVACAGTPEVRQFGGMREVLREGHTEPRAALAEFAAPGWFAVGALAGLQGEATLHDGRWSVAVAAPEGARFLELVGEAAARSGLQATLLTAARVDGWDERALPAADEERLAAAIAELREGDPEPVPFLVEGTATRLSLHVVRGACPDAGDPEAPKPFRLELAEPVPVVLVGFFAPGKEGVMTHHGTALHCHALLSRYGQRITGHVDGFELAAGARLRLPQ